MRSKHFTTPYMQSPPPAVFHDKYQWEIWKNTAGKSASLFVEVFVCSQSHMVPILSQRCYHSSTVLLSHCLGVNTQPITVLPLVQLDHHRSWCNLLLSSILNLVQSQSKVRELVSLCEMVRPSTLVPSCFATLTLGRCRVQHGSWARIDSWGFC